MLLFGFALRICLHCLFWVVDWCFMTDYLVCYGVGLIVICLY